MPTPKVIVTFCYNGEDILNLQLKTLAPAVDLFVVVEGRYTFSGNRKDSLYVDQEPARTLLASYGDKVHVLKVEEFPDFPPKDFDYVAHPSVQNNGPAWFREQWQRDAGRRFALANFTGEFILIAVDVDEIVRREVVYGLPGLYDQLSAPVHFEMQFHYYSFAWIKKSKWYHAFVMNDIAARKYTLDRVRNGMISQRVLPNAGWHCSFFMSNEEMRRKLESFSHRECDMPEYKAEDHLNKCVTQGVDIINRTGAEELVPYNLVDIPADARGVEKYIGKV